MKLTDEIIKVAQTEGNLKQEEQVSTLKMTLYSMNRLMNEKDHCNIFICAPSQRWLVPFRHLLCSVEPAGQRRDREAGGCFPGFQNLAQGEKGHDLYSGKKRVMLT